MDPKSKEDNPKEFGKVIDTLHNKAKLPSLRTYQGDMAEFIKEKNESVISIAVKEKERKEERKEEAEKIEPRAKSIKSNKQDFPIKLTIIFLSVLLVVGGVLASLFIFQSIKKQPQNNLILKDEIIPYNNLITLANVTNESLESELMKLSVSGGINVVKIYDAKGVLFLKAKDFFNFLKVPLPGTLDRTLKDEYVVGVISGNQGSSSFIIITVNDFGQAFSAMLDWEESMPKDLSFLGTEINTGGVANSPTSTTTASSTNSVQVMLIKPDIFNWKDIIVKNKDTRGLINNKNQSKIAYTFLDKNTILITNNISVVAEIVSIYAARSVAR